MKKFLNILRLIIAWTFAIHFLSFSVVFIFSKYVLASILCTIIGLLLIPQISSIFENKIKEKWNIQKFWVVKTVICFILTLFMFFSLANKINEPQPQIVDGKITTESNHSNKNQGLVFILMIMTFGLGYTSIRFMNENNSIKIKYKDITNLDEEIEKRRSEIDNIKKLKDDYNTKSAYYTELKEALALVEEENDILEFGVYKPRFYFDISAKYKMALERNYDKQKAFFQNSMDSLKYIDDAIFKKDKLNMMKLVYRAFNAECDAIISKVNWKNANQMIARVNKVYEVLNKLGENSIFMTSLDEDDLELKLEELYLTHEYALKKEEEKEEQKRIQEQIREEQKVIKEFENARIQAEKEEQTYQRALLQAQKDLEKASEQERSAFEEKIALLQKQLQEVEERKERAISQAQLTKCGYIYVISNIGSFGENVYKIGMTRRLEPMERINELGDASVPFKFDVHAMIFSENAPELESKLHSHFRDRSVNMVNFRKEFFNVSLEEIEKVVRENYAEIEFMKIAEAKEYRETMSIRQSKEVTPEAIACQEEAIFPNSI